MKKVSVLMVCTANICRSPYMELMSRHLVSPHEGATFASAGTRGFDSQPMPKDMANTLLQRGVPGVVPFRSRPFTTDLMANADLNKQFVAQAEQAGLTNLAGHRSVGGMRASIYNAMPQAGVDALIEFMKEFERVHA